MASLVFFNGQPTTCSSQITATQTSIVGQSTATWSPVGDYFVRIDGFAPGTTTAIFELIRVSSNTQGSGTIVCLRGQGSTAGQAFAANATLTPVVDATAINIALARIDTSATQAFSGPISVPSSGGVALPSTGYGSMPVKIDDILVGTDTRYPSATAQITFLNTSNSGTNLLPTGFRHLVLEWYARGDTAAANVNLVARFNNDAGANYDYQLTNTLTATTLSTSEVLGGNGIQITFLPGATATANYFGSGEAKIKHYQSAVGNKVIFAQGAWGESNLTGAAARGLLSASGKWRTTGTAITRLDLVPSAGNFINGSLFTLWGYP